MTFRGPSLGFVYLCLAAAAFCAFFWWVRRPMWWDEADRRVSEVAEAEYLFRIAQPDAERRPAWLAASLRLATRQREWDLCARSMAAMMSDGLPLPGSVARELSPGRVWLLGSNAERWSSGARPMILYVVNEAANDLRLELTCSARRSGKGHVRGRGQPWRAFDLTSGEDVTVEHVVPAGVTTWVELRADEGNFEFADTNAPGVRIAKLEVAP